MHRTCPSTYCCKPSFHVLAKSMMSVLSIKLIDQRKTSLHYPGFYTEETRIRNVDHYDISLQAPPSSLIYDVGGIVSSGYAMEYWWPKSTTRTDMKTMIEVHLRGEILANEIFISFFFNINVKNFRIMYESSGLLIYFSEFLIIFQDSLRCSGIWSLHSSCTPEVFF